MIGKTVSHYKIVSKIGEGGMGEVWEAHDPRLDRAVAIKLIPKHLSADPAARRRFVREARSASAIEHANICTIHEINETSEGETFIVMPRYQGELLSDRIARGRLPLVEALKIVEDLAGALAEAHDHDIIHRDVKPQNIIIDPHGRPILLDFGLAKLTERTKLTKTGTTVGTLSYMSPEQAAGEAVDGRADLFSLGVVLYELVTGVRPFRGEHDVAVLYSIANETPAQLVTHDPSLPAALQSIIDRSLAKDPGERFTNMDEFKMAVAELRNGLQPGSASATIARGSQRSQWMIPGVMIVVALIAIAVWRLLPGGGTSDPAAQSIAVIEFSDLTGSNNANRTIGLAGLIHVGMVENAPCRVVSPTYLQDLRRRLFGAVRGPIEEGQALEVARESGATLLLSGQMGELDGRAYATWQLVETKSGASVVARRVEAAQLTDLADAVLAGVVPALGERCGKPSSDISSVSELTTADPNAYRYFVAGALANEHGSYDEAVALLDNAVALDSTFALAHFELARVHRGRLVYGLARDHTEQAWRWRSRLSIQDRMRLDAWRETINYRVVGAIEIYRELHDRWPDNKEILEELSLQLWFWWFHNDCVEVCQSAMALYPDEAAFAQRYQAALAVTGRTQDALKVARRNVVRFPDNPNQQDELALRYIEAGYPDSAEAIYHDVLREQPDFFWSRMGIAALPYYRGNLGEAEVRLSAMASNSGLPAQSRYGVYTRWGAAPVGLAVVLYDSGQYGKLLDILEAAGRLKDDPVERLYYERFRYLVLLKLGRADEVLRWVDGKVARLSAGQGAAADNPQLTGVARWTQLDYRARALAAMDSLDAAREAAAMLMDEAKSYGNHARLQSYRVTVQIALRAGDAAAALAALDGIAAEGIGAGYHHVTYLEMRAEAYRLAGRYEDAVAAHEALLRIFGGHAVSYYELGRISEAMDRPNDAVQAYERFLDMWARADEGLLALVDVRRRLDKLR